MVVSDGQFLCSKWLYGRQLPVFGLVSESKLQHFVFVSLCQVQRGFWGGLKLSADLGDIASWNSMSFLLLYLS